MGLADPFQGGKLVLAIGRRPGLFFTQASLWGRLHGTAAGSPSMCIQRLRWGPPDLYDLGLEVVGGTSAEF